jgi:hypothetical protein
MILSLLVGVEELVELRELRCNLLDLHLQHLEFAPHQSLSFFHFKTIISIIIIALEIRAAIRITSIMVIVELGAQIGLCSNSSIRFRRVLLVFGSYGRHRSEGDGGDLKVRFGAGLFQELAGELRGNGRARC